MKFGKVYESRMVPEWVDAYMDYDGLKKILRQIRSSQVPKTPQTPLRTIQNKFSIYSPLRMLKVESKSKLNEGDVEDQVLKFSPITPTAGESSRTMYRTTLLLPPDEIGREREVEFFEKLDSELNKVITFYSEKVAKVAQETEELNKQMNAYDALRLKVKHPSFKWPDPDTKKASTTTTPTREVPSSSNSGAGSSNVNSLTNRRDLRTILDHVRINDMHEGPISIIIGLIRDLNGRNLNFSKREFKEVEEQLKVAFTEFYHNLQLLKNYSFMNLSAFAKIMKKYDKITSRNASKLYMKIVDKSFLGSSDEVTKLMEKVERKFVKIFFSAKPREGMKTLRPQPKREKHRVTFFSGFFSGCSVALVIAIILLIRARKILKKEEGFFYLDNMFGLYRQLIFVSTPAFAHVRHDIYFWKRYRINYPFIFNFKQGTELGFQQVFLISTGLAVFVLATFLADFNLIIGLKAGDPKTFAKLIPVLVVSVLLIILVCPFNIIYRSSRFFLIRHLFRCIFAPFYEVTLSDFFLADQLTSQISAIRSIEFYACYYSKRGFPKGQSTCHDNGVYDAFYYVIAVIPYWIRFLQCLRRLVQERDIVHGFNALKYLMAVVAVVIRTVYELKKGTAWLVMALVSSAMAVVYNTYWDIVVDWGLLRWNSHNFCLRDKMVVPHKSVYYIAMGINVLLRAAWLQFILEFNIKGLRKTAISTTISCLEIVRRGMWNFFRLENEHLNNVGKFRAFRSVPLPFQYHDHKDDDEDKEEKED